MLGNEEIVALIRLGLDSITALLNKLNNPQDKLQIIHIAGTNAKGSVGTMISCILREASYKVGHYSSPAVFSREEVIKINGKSIKKDDYDIYQSKVENAGIEMTGEGLNMPTEFEIETALAFEYFRDNKCDVVVLECGMGGMSDATNVVKNSKVCVFTPISIDHTDYLGKSLREIAANKAGIIKAGAKAVSARQSEEVEDILINKANECGVELIHAKEAVLKKTDIGLTGISQMENAYLAITAVEAFDGNISLSTCIRGLKKVKLPGRFERINDKPVIIIDGGHNIAAALNLVRNIESLYKNKEYILVAGMLFNKDHKGVMDIIASKAKQVLTISTFGDRGYSAENLAYDVMDFNKNVSAIGGIEEALEIACMSANKKDIIVVFGSFTFLKAAKKWQKDRFGR